MEENSKEIQRLLGGCAFVAIFVVVGCVFPWGLIILIPYTLYLYGKHSDEKEKINNFLKSEFQGMTPNQIEQKRMELLDIIQNPYSTKTDKENAKYAIKYIEDNFYNIK